MIAPTVALAVLRLGLRLELAPEYDSNANRVEAPTTATDPAPVGSFLLQTALRGRLAYRAGPYDLHVALDGGAKFFFADAAQPQDTAVVRAQLDATRLAGQHGSIHVAGEYYDSFQWNDCPPVVGADGVSVPDTSCHRDFRLASLRLGGSVFERIPSLLVEGGVRRYEWKPDPDLSFVGLSASGGPSLRLREWGLSLTGRFEWRRFDGGALASAADLGGSDPNRPRRSDDVAGLGASLGYTGSVVASASWLVETDRSNSYGGAYLYQMVILKLAVPLPGEVTVATRAQLLFFSQGELPVSLSADEENRDSVLVDLSRGMGKGVSLGGRYLVFRSASGDAGHEYLRQVVSVWVSWAGGR